MWVRHNARITRLLVWTEAYFTAARSLAMAICSIWRTRCLERPSCTPTCSNVAGPASSCRPNRARRIAAFAFTQPGKQITHLVPLAQAVMLSLPAEIGNIGNVLDPRMVRFLPAVHHQWNASRKPFHQGEGCIRAETVSPVNIEAFNRAHERDVSIADQFHQRQAGTQMLARDAHDKPQVRANDLVLGFARRREERFHSIEIARSRELRLQIPTRLHKLELVEIKLQKQRALPLG